MGATAGTIYQKRIQDQQATVTVGRRLRLIQQGIALVGSRTINKHLYVHNK